MAYGTIGIYEWFRLCSLSNCLPDFKMIQQIIAFGILIVAIVFLVKKFFFKKKNGKNCGNDCGCS
ncbi:MULTISPECIES: FeoB-associated Cys-rich membrane protein [Flavobacterium]|uniref:FeoB-associated Cys-rich membrane protein n=1 Tax=Flavobacterium TaxID=237 RepID=UPI0029CABAEE|nr:FeoB-associated Cys-rich membrane protein [Flavobacterium sp. N1846]